jgi:hypothetical protein
MLKFPVRLRALVAGAVVAVAASPAFLWAAPSASEKTDKTVNSVEQLHANLDKTITIEIKNQSLTLAVKMLSEKSGINFSLDSLTIQQQLGYSPDQPPTPVDLPLQKDVKVRNVLRSIVAPYGLGYAVTGDLVVITTQDVATARQMHQAVTVDLNQVAFSAALKQLAKETYTNLVLDGRFAKEAETKVSLQAEETQLDTAVRVLAEEANLRPVRVGNVLFVTSKEIANEMRQDPDLVQPVQPGQPQPGVIFAPPLGALVPPPTVIGNPPTAPTVLPAVDPDKPADAPKPPADAKPDPDKKDPKDTDK